MIDDDLEDEPEAPQWEPTRPMQRLALAVLLQAASDFTAARDPAIWGDAKTFLFPKDEGSREHFRWTVEVSAIDPFWFDRQLRKARERAAPLAQFKTCKQCQQCLPVADFYPTGKRSGALKGSCKKCMIQTELRRYREHRVPRSA